MSHQKSYHKCFQTLGEREKEIMSLKVRYDNYYVVTLVITSWLMYY